MATQSEPTGIWPLYGVLARDLVPILGRDAVYEGPVPRPLWDREVLERLFLGWATPRGVTLWLLAQDARSVAHLTSPSGAQTVGRGQRAADALAVAWLALLHHPGFKEDAS